MYCAMVFFYLQDYLQEIMARFCVVVTLAVCCLVTGSNGTDPGPASGRYTRFVAGIPCDGQLVSGIIEW